jgi:hypothetical protein
MANTMKLISSQTVASGGAASVTFSSIPSTYTDLKLIISARTSRASDGDYIYLSLNGTAQADVGRYLKGYSTVAETGTVSDNYLGVPSTNNTASVFGNIEIYFPNYNSTTAKSIYALTGYADGNASAESAGTYSWTSGSASTSAITSITLTGRFASFIQYSNFYLYGINNS